jgi:agmatinase
MKIVVVPGVNGLEITKGVEDSYLEILKEQNFEKIDLNRGNIEEQLNQIIVESKKYFSEKKTLFLGGDHSISYGLVLNFFKKYKNGKLIVFDAHPDLMSPMPEPSHEEWLRGVIDKLGILGEKVLIVGVRRNSKNVEEKEIEYAKEKRIQIIYSDEFEIRKQEILNFVSGDVYCSLDVDVFDSSLVGSTGYPEKGGVGLELLNLLGEIKEKVGFWDLVEVNLKKGNKKDKEKTKKIVRKILKTLF